MAIELKSASHEEIAEFKLAAARRYKEKGIPAKLASVMFDHYMAKMASQLGVTHPAPARIQKLAEQLKPAALKLKSMKPKGKAKAKC